MELRNYLQVAWRRRWIIALVIALVVELSIFFQINRTEIYESTAEILLLPNNPAERLTADPGGYFDPERHAALQLSVIGSAEVAAAAAEALGGPSADDVRDAITVRGGNEEQSLFVAARDEIPEEASRIANAVAEAYIENRRRTAVDSLQAAADEVGVQLAALSDRIVDLEAQAEAAGVSDTTEDASLEAANLQFLTLYGRQQEILIDITLKRGEAEIIGPAEVPDTPVGTSLPVAIALGALVGAMAGLALAFLIDHLDDRVRSEEEIEAITGLPVLASLPLDRASSRKGRYLATADDPLGHLAEASRSLRTSIALLSIDGAHGRLMVTSATPRDGKTLVAANLGAAYAQAGYRTVLVSADLRRPRLETVFGVRIGQPGLSELLAQEGGARMRLARPGVSPSPADTAVLHEGLEDALLGTTVPDLMLLPAGSSPPNPSELLASHRMDEVRDLLSGSFDMVILDTSPMLAVADPAVLAPKVGVVVLVASLTGTRRNALKQVTRAVRATRAEFLGVIANRSTVKRTSYSGYSEPVEAGSRPSRNRRRDADVAPELPSPAEQSAS